ncbi:protein of unknown function [Nitrospira japonica]|uniref:Uncharacterized protein n=1 Tax=Nitrospira japonica TaxID=1325564 RepID=A0A1W1I1D2_9BACT|nr:hypothetical protein [Nitrospira japonica]SLM46791.1 protein of unknown function [Nitrospira japonica]
MIWDDGIEEPKQADGWYLYRPLPTSTPVPVKVRTIGRLKYVAQYVGHPEVGNRRLRECHGTFLRPLAVHEIPCAHMETLTLNALPEWKDSEEWLCPQCGAVLGGL